MAASRPRRYDVACMGAPSRTPPLPRTLAACCLAIEVPLAVLALLLVGASALGLVDSMLLFAGLFYGALLTVPVVGAVVVAVLSSRGRSRRPLHALAAFVAVYVSIMATQWPLRIAFAAARPELERIAGEARRGIPFHGPQRAGL